MMLASSAIAASPLSGDYIKAVDASGAPAKTFVIAGNANMDAEAVTGLAKVRQIENAKPAVSAVVVADIRQEIV
ncbi:hypothetical protein [Kordiimonas sp.]|uniref:hypothetical protein n=1 Tax=Kordiimonas sp. TaxID=1970157 RepID=UPI003A8ECCC2